ncbi:MAG: WG repeat-containing protein [Fluviicola sp.]
MRQRIICFLLLFSFGAWSQESSEAASASEAGSVVIQGIENWDSLSEAYHSFIPFKTTVGWTFYDLNDSTLHHEYAFDEWVPQNGFSDYYALRKGEHFGVVSMEGDTILPFEYDTVVTTQGDVLGRKDGKWGLLVLTDNHYETVMFSLDSMHQSGQYLYLYRNNKVGLYLYGAVVVPPKYEAVQPLSANELYNKSPNAILAFDGTEFSFFDYSGRDLLGTSTPEFELMRDNFVRYQSEGRWKYYNFTTEKTFDSQGNDVVIYSTDSYKIYGPDRKYPTFYQGDQTLSGFEDYFPWDETYLAFRSFGKVGLIDIEGTVHIPAKYDKIELISAKQEYFKFFRGDSCGLVTKNGTELFQPAFANIIATKKANRLLVTDNGFTGVVDEKGKIIIPLEYDFIEYGNECFFLRKGNMIGLASIDGKIIFKPQFTHYKTESGRGAFYAIVFRDFSGGLHLANKQGRLTSKKFYDYNFGNQTFKLYRRGEIEVLVLSEDTQIEESVKYANVQSMEIRKPNYVSQVNNGLEAWDPSYLEENQLNGKFGLRHFTKRGIAVAPVYKEVQPNGLNSYFGERLDEGNFQLTQDVMLRRRAVYDQMYIGSGKIQNYDLVSAESLGHISNFRSGATVVGQDKNHFGTIEHPYKTMPFEFNELEDFNIGFSFEFDRNLPKMYIINAKPIVCDIDAAELSLFEYYHYFNMLGGLRMTPEVAKRIMNPTVGVRFVGGSRRVSDRNTMWSNENRIRFNPWETFYDFQFTEVGDFVFSKELDDTTLWDLRDYRWPKDEEAYESRKCIDFEERSEIFGTVLELKETGKTQYIIHEDFPSFEYILCDSLDRSYFAGRLIHEDEKGYTLKDPAGKEYTSYHDNIAYLGEGVFAVKNDQMFSVIDRSGDVLINREFSRVGNVNNGFFTASNSSFIGIYSIEGDVLVESNETLEHVEGNFYRVSPAPNEVWFHAATKVYDTLRLDEVYLGNETFMTKSEKGDYSLRKFGESASHKISTEIKPYCMLEVVIYKKKKKLFVLDAAGRESTFKKASKPRMYGNFMRIDGKKNKLILNEKGELIHTAEEGAKLKIYRDQLWVHTADTNVLVSQSGEVKPLNYEKVTTYSQSAGKDVTIVMQKGKFGAEHNDDSIIPNKFDRLTYLGNGEFMATHNFTKNLFDSHLEQLNPIPYSESYFISEDILVLELNGAWFYYQKMEGWEPIK